jgi:glycosyltransferase involved in cell wall biosynthesis
MTLGYFSPMPPAPTGVADYSEALLPHLRVSGEVRVNEPGERNLYHIGNNHLHREIYQRALAEPGTVVIHDAVLHHFMLGILSESEYVAEFVYDYGNEPLARELWRERARSGVDPRYFAYPMLKRIVERSKGIIVHNAAAARIVKAHVPETSVTEIPHLFREPAAAESARSRLGIPADALLAGTFGHQRETKRLHVLLRAFHRALERGTNIYLLVSGAFVSGAFEKSIAPLLAHPRILRTGYLPEPEFWAYARAVDVCVNLRYPTAAETSGIAISMMGIGKPVIFTSGEEIARFPESACLRIEAGAGEESALAEYLTWLAASPGAARAIGERAASHILAEHAPEKVARMYWEAAV